MKWNYPKIQSDTAIDYYYGKKIIDPYRNLEDVNSEYVKNWLEKQRAFCDSALSKIKNHSSLKEDLEQYLNSTKVKGGFPRPVDEKLFYVKKFISTNIDKLYYYNGLSEDTIEMFNTENLNKTNGSIYNIDYYEPSPDGKYVAMGISPDGTESSSIYIIDVEKRHLLKDYIGKTMTVFPQWLPDGSGFFYSRLKDLKTKEDSSTIFEDISAYLHLLGTSQNDDKLIVNRLMNEKLALKKIDAPLLTSFPESEYIFLQIMEGVSPYITLYYAPLMDVLNQDTDQIYWRKICDGENKIKYFAPHQNFVYLMSFNDNSNGKLLKVKMDNSDYEKVIFEDQEFVLQELIRSKEAIYMKCIYNGINRIIAIDLDNDSSKFIPLPFNGSIEITPNFPVGISNSNSISFYFKMRSWNQESEVYCYNPIDDHVTNANILQSESLSSQNKLKVEEVEVTSHDGVKVPLSIIYSSDVKLNGENPLVIYAYGAYGYSIMPYFSMHRMAWYNRGIIFAVAHVRGGGEKGDNWHKGGFKETKSNSWKDLISCTEYLIKKKYTNPSKIIAKGESAGAITVGRAIQERPDLYKASVIKVGALNIIRDELESTGNTTEFGTVQDSLEFKYLYEMDVYHHLQEDIEYPSLYLTAGLNDYRVPVWQPAKIVSRMQAFEKKDNIVLFRVGKEGHFYGSDYSQDLTDEYTFIFWQLGINGFEYSNTK